MTSFKIKTQKKVAFWGAVDSIPLEMRFYKHMLKHCGENTGNMFIGRGLFNALDAPKKEYWDIYERPPEEFNEHFDCLFIPASNFIFENTDLADQEAYFSKTNAQIFMFGLGSQTAEVRPVTLKPGTDRFLRMVADRSSSIGVRGEVTAEIMYRMGFKNVRVVGCPSMLSIPDTFKEPVKKGSAPKKVAGTFTNNGRDHSTSPQKMADVESQFFHQLICNNGYYILQNERHELAAMSLASWKEELTDREYFELVRVKELFQSPFNLGRIAAFLLRRGKIFFDTEEWIDFVGTLDFVFGTRFHGSVAAILAGVPAHVLTHDLRTFELCRTYSIPFTSIENIKVTTTYDDLYHRTSMSEFSQRFITLCNIWQDFAAENGFESSLRLAE